MTGTPATSNGKRNIWLRGRLMILMAIAFHLSGMLLASGAITQFLRVLLSKTPTRA